MQHVPLPHYEPTKGMRSANIQVKGLVRAGELVNHSTIVIAGFRVYTPLAKHRLPFDGCVCAHYVPFAGVRNHSGTARTSVCSELRKVMDYGVIVESRRGILSTFSITTWNRWLVCPFAPRGLHYGDSWLDFIMYALTVGVRWRRSEAICFEDSLLRGEIFLEFLQDFADLVVYWFRSRAEFIWEVRRDEMITLTLFNCS